MTERPLSLFEGFGVELEYMIVDARTLDVLPVADRLLNAVSGEMEAEVEVDELAWSNELVLHVVELKTNGPAPDLAPLAALFQDHVRRINALLEPLGGRLLPTAMHPWMDPERETRLWPHEYNAIYQTYNRIFGCRGHGWANLQSTHLNLPFADDAEFARLHAAIRLVLPILPALAAASPIVRLRTTDVLDNRLAFYRTNQRGIPEIIGPVVPEPVFDRGSYHALILEPMYRAVASADPDGIIQHEWLNSRGAIARFDRSAIEIRLLDIQECPAADLAIVSAITAVLKSLVEERSTPLARQQAWRSEDLAKILLDAERDGEGAVIRDADYLRTLGVNAHAPLAAGEAWRALIEALEPVYPDLLTPALAPLRAVFEEGTLSRRILRATGPNPSPEVVRAVYGRLADCLARGAMFRHAN